MASGKSNPSKRGDLPSFLLPLLFFLFFILLCSKIEEGLGVSMGFGEARDSGPLHSHRSALPRCYSAPCYSTTTNVGLMCSLLIHRVIVLLSPAPPPKKNLPPPRSRSSTFTPLVVGSVTCGPAIAANCKGSRSFILYSIFSYNELQHSLPFLLKNHPLLFIENHALPVHR